MSRDARVLSTALILGFVLTDDDARALRDRLTVAGFASGDSEETIGEGFDAVDEVVIETGDVATTEDTTIRILGLTVYTGGEGDDPSNDLSREAIETLRTRPEDAEMVWLARTRLQLDVLANQAATNIYAENMVGMLRVLLDWMTEPQQRDRVWAWRNVVHSEW